MEVKWIEMLLVDVQILRISSRYANRQVNLISMFGMAGNCLHTFELVFVLLTFELTFVFVNSSAHFGPTFILDTKVKCRTVDNNIQIKTCFFFSFFPIDYLII